MSSHLPGAVGVSRLSVYETTAPDGLHGGTPHMHLTCSEGYVVTAGEGRVQTLSGEGYRETPLRAGTVAWFRPGTIHRLVNDGGLQLVVLMQNSGLPEAGDAVLTFPSDMLSDPEVYRAAATLPSGAGSALPGGAAATLPGGAGSGLPDGAAATLLGGVAATLPGGAGSALPGGAAAVLPSGAGSGSVSAQQHRAGCGESDLAPAYRRRDLAVTGFLAMRAAGPEAFTEFCRAAAALVAPRLGEWRLRWESGALEVALETGRQLDALEKSDLAHLADGGIEVLAGPTESGKHGMCGLLETYIP